MAGKPPFKPQLIAGYAFDEVSSALNKAIRRNQEYEAAYWSMIIHNSNFGQYLWRRLSVINAEDCGSADPAGTLLLHALRSGWEALHKQSKEATGAKLALVIQAVIYLCNSPKTREIDSLRNLILKNFERGERLEIPSIAIDPHCEAGRKLYGKFGQFKDGRERERLKRWYEESSVVVPEAYPNKWLEKLQAVEELMIKEAETNQ